MEQQDVSIPKRNGISLRVLCAVMVVLAAVVALALVLIAHNVDRVYDELSEASSDYILCESAAEEMAGGSDFLTTQVHYFVVTHNPDFLEQYFWEVNTNMRRERALETFQELQTADSANLQQALADSDALMELELHAMRLVAEAMGFDDMIQEHLSAVTLSPDDQMLSSQDKLDRAEAIVFSDEYMDYKDRIEKGIVDSKQELLSQINQITHKSRAALVSLLRWQRAFAVLFFLIFASLVISVVALVLMPLRSFTSNIQAGKPLPESGSSELRYTAVAYNEMYAENMENNDKLRQKAEHDHLTGLYNRSVFELLLEKHGSEPYALVIVDLDHFKEINDSLGHSTGDAALKKVSGLLTHAFRATDFVCRIGGDEFVVFMTGMTEDLKHVVDAKMAIVREGLQQTADGLPVLMVSAGIAFNDGTLSGEEVFRRADQALYQVKEAGRNGLAFYDAD